MPRRIPWKVEGAKFDDFSARIEPMHIACQEMVWKVAIENVWWKDLKIAVTRLDLDAK